MNDRWGYETWCNILMIYYTMCILHVKGDNLNNDGHDTMDIIWSWYVDIIVW